MTAGPGGPMMHAGVNIGGAGAGKRTLFATAA